MAILTTTELYTLKGWILYYVKIRKLEKSCPAPEHKAEGKVQAARCLARRANLEMEPKGLHGRLCHFPCKGLPGTPLTKLVSGVS